MTPTAICPICRDETLAVEVMREERAQDNSWPALRSSVMPGVYKAIPRLS